MIAKPRCGWRGRRIAWCRKLKKFCEAPREYNTCPFYAAARARTSMIYKVHRNVGLLRDQVFPAETKGWREAFPETLRLKPLFDMQDTLIEHKFPHEKSAIIDWIISCPGDIYRNITHGYPDFGYIIEKWERLSSYTARPPLSKLQANDWEEIRNQLQDPSYKVQRDQYLSNLQRLREETVKFPMDEKRRAVMLASLDMISGLISWFESLNPAGPPSKDLDRLTGAIATYFPEDFWRSPRQEITDEEIRRRKLDNAFWWIDRNYAGKKVTLNPVSILMENSRLMVPHDEEILVEAMRLAESKLGLKFNWWKYEHYKRLREAKSQALPSVMVEALFRAASSTESLTSGLKSKFGHELKEMITEAEREKREVGAMLCCSPSGDIHLSRTCYGRRETVMVRDCHDGRPLGSFHAHTEGIGVFSVPDLELAIRKEQLSCLGYMKAGVPMLKCILPKRYYELPAETKAWVKRSLDQAKQDIETATRLFRESTSSESTSSEAIALSQRAKATLSDAEQLLGAYEVEL